MAVLVALHYGLHAYHFLRSSSLVPESAEDMECAEGYPIQHSCMQHCQERH